MKNVEFKAKINQAQYDHALEILMIYFSNQDHQIDTYFNVKNGRLKLRESNFENYLIQYNREDIAGIKESKYQLFPVTSDSNILKLSLTNALGVLAVVDKVRNIYFINNVKIHLDSVQGLDGHFMEIEARDELECISNDDLKEQCLFYVRTFDIKDFESKSYSDLIIEIA